MVGGGGFSRREDCAIATKGSERSSRTGGCMVMRAEEKRWRMHWRRYLKGTEGHSQDKATAYAGGAQHVVAVGRDCFALGTGRPWPCMLHFEEGMQGGSVHAARETKRASKKNKERAIGAPLRLSHRSIRNWGPCSAIRDARPVSGPMQAHVGSVGPEHFEFQ